jgi:hypothetical protein
VRRAPSTCVSLFLVLAMHVLVARLTFIAKGDALVVACLALIQKET